MRALPVSSLSFFSQFLKVADSIFSHGSSVVYKARIAKVEALAALGVLDVGCGAVSVVGRTRFLFCLVDCSLAVLILLH